MLGISCETPFSYLLFLGPNIDQTEIVLVLVLLLFY